MLRYKIMAEAVTDIGANLLAIKLGIENAVKKRAQDLPSSTKQPVLIAVSKTKSLAQVRKAYEEGQRHFGENYMKELVMKSTNPDIADLCPDIKWHYIGSFNKKMANSLTRVSNLHMLHTLASKTDADALNKRWKGQPLKVMIQVNTSGEENKSGVKPSECVDLATHVVNNCKQFRLTGLMTIGAFGHDYSLAPNPDFECLRQCHQSVCKDLNIPETELELSMGMSNDYQQAIESGSTYVRVGTSIFGARDQ